MADRRVEHEPAPAKPAPNPTNAQTLQAAQEREAYFAYLNAKRRGEDVKPPKLTQPTDYWQNR